MKEPKKLEPKELMELIEDYGTTMRELGAVDADITSMRRKGLFLNCCKLIAKIEREIIK